MWFLNQTVVSHILPIPTGLRPEVSVPVFCLREG